MLIPRAAIARAALPDALREAGAQVDVVDAYQTVGPDAETAAEIRASLEGGAIDVVTFTSPSTVQRVVEALGGDPAPLGRVALACIGPITAAAVEERGLEVATSASEYTVEGLTDALLHYYREP